MIFNKCKYLIEYVLSLPKSLYFCLHYFTIKKAIRFPILISRKTKLDNLKGKIIFQNNTYFGMVKIGFSGSYNLGNKSYFNNEGGVIIFNKKATFSRGIQLICGRDAKIEFGDNFRCNSNCIINSGNNIKFGEDVLLSWNFQILDGDGHIILYNYNTKNKTNNNIVNLENHIWVCSNCSLLKGTKIKSNCIIAANSCINKEIEKSNVIVASNNKIVRENINWIE